MTKKKSTLIHYYPTGTKTEKREDRKRKGKQTINNITCNIIEQYEQTFK